MNRVAEILAPYSPREDGNAIWVEVPPERALDLLRELREAGYVYLATISGVDWPEEGKLELVYHLWSFDERGFVHLKTRVPRGSPSIPSVYPLFGGSAWINEREIHEMFGVDFPGNPDLSPLFLDDWDGPPPFRKDFDWRAYVREKFYREDREEDRGYYKD